MAASQEQKVDFLLKKIGYVSSKTGIAEDSTLSGTTKAPFAEPIPSPLVVPSTSIWSDSSLIPATPPGSTSATVQVYATATAKQLTVDSTVSGNRTFLARATPGNNSTAMEGNWIDPSFGSDYVIKVFRGDPNSGGSQLSAAGSGSNDTWFFDYSSGVLNFNGTAVPTGITTNNIYLVGYRYLGGTGFNVSGIATFTSTVVDSLTEDRVVFVGSGSSLTDSANFTFNDNNLTVTGGSSITGVSTFGASNGIGTVTVGAGGSALHVDGDARIIGKTFIGDGTITIDPDNDLININGSQIQRDAGGDLMIMASGTSNYSKLRASDLLIGTNTVIDNNRNYTGVAATFTTLTVSGDLTVEGTTTTLDTILTEVDKLEVAANNTTVGAAITQSGTGDILNLYDGSTEVFSVEDGGRIVGTATSSVIPFLHPTLASLPSASTYHGAFAHVHSEGKGYFAHGGNWFELVNKELNGTVGVGIERYNVGFVDATNLDVSGVSTFAGLADFNGNIDVDGYTELDDLNVAGVSTFAGLADFNGNIDVDGYTELDDLNVAGVSTFAGLVDINGGGQANTFKVEDLTENRVVIVGTGGELEDDANFTFDGIGLIVGGNLNVTGISTFASAVDINADLDVDGRTELDTTNIADTLNVTGISTFASAVDINADLDVDGRTELDITNISETLSVTGISTFTGNIDANGDLDVDGQTDLDVLNVAEDATFTSTVYLNGTVSVGSSTGANGQVLSSTGVGVTWTTLPTARTTTTITATEDQTTFNFTYNVGFLDVFYNGVKLANTEFTASNGTSVILNDVAYAGDLVEFVSYGTVSTGGGGGAQNLNGLADVVITGSPVVGETLQHNGTTFVNDYTVSQTTTATTQVALLSLDLSVYRSAEYTIQVTEGSNYHVTKILAVHNGTAASHNEYGTLNIGSSLATFDVDISGSNLRLLATPAGTNSTVFKVKFTAIKV